MSPTQKIEASISDARAQLAALDREVDRLSLPAATGDADAVEALSKVQASIRSIAADLSILDRARVEAAKQDVAIDAADDAVYRARHPEIAREHAAEIVRFAQRADEAVAAFDQALAGIASAEADIWRALAAAGERPSGTVVGRQGLGLVALAQMREATARTNPKIRKHKSVAAVAAVAWGCLLDNRGYGR